MRHHRPYDMYDTIKNIDYSREYDFNDYNIINIIDRPDFHYIILTPKGGVKSE